MPLSNAEKCKNYRKRKKDGSKVIQSIVRKTNAENCRMYRLRKKMIAQGYSFSKSGVMYIPCTSNLQMFDPTPLHFITEPKLRIIHDPIPYVQNPGEMVEITVPSLNTEEGPVGVIIKEEPLDIHTETVEALPLAGVCAKNGKVLDECSRMQAPKQGSKKKAMTQKSAKTNINVTEIPVEVTFDPISPTQHPKKMLEITVPSLNPVGGPVGVTIKEEPVDVHTETVEALPLGDVSVKKEIVDYDYDTDVIADGSIMRGVMALKQEPGDED